MPGDPTHFANTQKCSRLRQRDGQSCQAPAVRDSVPPACRKHLGRPVKALRAETAVRDEVTRWTLGDTSVDPGEVLLRLVTQSAARAEMYAELLRDAYEAAERMKAAHEAQDLLVAAGEVDAEEDEYESPALLRAREDLDRIFNVGGVSALVGHTYASTQTGGVYASGEAIRGLATLEAAERDRCAGFAAKAVAAGLAERQVRLAERQASIVAEALSAVLAELGLSSEQQQEARRGVARHLRLVAG